MRVFGLITLSAAVCFAPIAYAQSGSVDVVRVCLSTVKLVSELSDAMELAESDSPEQAELVYDQAISTHYDDWLVFSVVHGDEAGKVLETNSAMGAVLVVSEDCIKAKDCRFGVFDRHADELQSKLPAACQLDYRKVN